MVDAFAGHELCNSSDGQHYLNGPIFTSTGPGDYADLTTPSRESMHPNLTGILDGYCPEVEEGMVTAGV
ncbi:hypothetical protein GCM10029992_61340 [Glycomyces albus]